jgi:hypothetical protein
MVAPSFLPNTMATAPDLRLSPRRWGMAARAPVPKGSFLFVSCRLSQLVIGWNGLEWESSRFINFLFNRQDARRDATRSALGFAQLSPTYGTGAFDLPSQNPSRLSGRVAGERSRCAVRMTAKGSVTPGMACGSRPVKRLP